MARRQSPQQRPRRPVRRRAALVQHAPIPAPFINGYAIQVTGPYNGYTAHTKRPTITVVPTSKLGTPMDVQVEWRTGTAYQQTVGGPWLPNPLYITTVSGAASGVSIGVTPPADLGNFSWYYRVRSGSSSANLWSGWSAQYYLNEQPVLGSTAHYIDANVGIAPATARGDSQYVEMNIGVAAATSRNSTLPVELNIGVALKAFKPALYSDMNIGPQAGRYKPTVYTDINVVSGQPTPHIWWIRPEQGKEGYVFNIYGHGFGQYQGQYNGQVKLGNLVCAVANWSVVPAPIRPGVVRASGTPRAASTYVTPPYLTMKASSITLAVGDTIEFDVMWEATKNIGIHPTFFDASNSTFMGGTLSLNDSTGTPWVADLPGAYNQWLHRKFTVPAGYILANRPINKFGLAWFSVDPLQPQQIGSVRSFVIKDANGNVKMWVTGEDGTTVSQTYTSIDAGNGVLSSSTFSQPNFSIVHGQSLTPDTITTEYGWIVAVVPPGAVSAGVEVLLGGS